LRVSKNCYNRIKHTPLTFRQLQWIQSKEKINKKWDYEDLIVQGNIEIEHPVIKQLTEKRITNYLLKQKEAYDLIFNDVYNEFGEETTFTQIYIHWKDYLTECQILNYDLTSDRVIRPSDLYSEHQKTSELVRHQSDESLRQIMQDRFKKLTKKYKFEHESLQVVVPNTQQQIIEEGELLHHCVGGYAKRHAQGMTTILFIRRTEKPNIPFYTLEIHNGMLKQCQGYKNTDYKKDKILKSFIELFDKKKLRRKAA